MRRTIAWYEGSRNIRLLPVHWCILCIMHLHNQVSEKKIVMLIKKGYFKREKNDEKEAFISAIESTMNACVLSSQYNETNWLIPLNEEKPDISTEISLTDMQSKKVIALINLLIADVFEEQVENSESGVEEWTKVIEYFSQLKSMIIYK